MEKYKEIANDPVKLEAALKDAWAKLDTKGVGYVTHEEFRAAAEAMSKNLNLPGIKPLTEEEKARAKKLLILMVLVKLPLKDSKLLFKLESQKVKKKVKFKKLIN